MTINKSFLLKKVFPIAAGACLGYAYYYFIGCNSGSCPITSNPWISTIYGGLAGFVFTIPNKKKADDNAAN